MDVSYLFRIIGLMNSVGTSYLYMYISLSDSMVDVFSIHVQTCVSYLLCVHKFIFSVI